MSLQIGRVVLVVVTVTAVMWGGCLNPEKPPLGPEEPRQALGTGSVTILSPIFLDGEIAHKNSNCTGCADSDFDIDRSGYAARVQRDSTHTGICGEKQVAIVFDSSVLFPQCAIVNATLTFHVKSTLSLNVKTHQLRIYSKKLTGSSPANLTHNEFIGCGTGYLDLGTITITGPGQRSFSIPNPDTNINKSGCTVFVIVDASAFENAEASQAAQIGMSEGSSPAELSVVTGHCIGPCLDGTVTHSGDVSCSECDSLAFDTTSPSARVYIEWGFNCPSYKQAAFWFDTSGLADTSTIRSATFRFNVKDYATWNVLTHELRVYTRKLAGACPLGFSNSDWVPCGTYIDLGTITIRGRGEHEFVVPTPDSSINKSGLTEFVLVDASTFDGIPHAEFTDIFTQEGGPPNSKPRLGVTY